MKDLTQGPVTRHLLHISAFLDVSMVVQILYLLADVSWVGHLVLRHELRKRLRFEEPETFIPASATAS